MKSLTERLQMAMRRVSGRTSLTENDIDKMMREIRLSLLEADVNFRVVKSFTNAVKEKALGEKILKGLNPGDQVVKVVFEELKKIMGEEIVPINYNKSKETIMMVVGLQGTGKTTSIAKLSCYTRKHDKRKPFIIAADVYRPAAIDQIKQLGKEINIPVYDEGQGKPLNIVKNGIKKAKEAGCDLIIIDTAGRLHIDEDMMKELKAIETKFSPDEILLTVDAMTGQDAANITKSFSEQLNITGAILTKLDGDTRGGAALSIREVSNTPIKFMSSGEKMDTFEPFHPDRIAQRILGMGDVLTLVEKVEQEIDEKEAEELAKKMIEGTYNYNDMLKQMKQIKRLGSLSRIMGFIPGIGKKLKEAVSQIDEKEFYKSTVLINSMTQDEKNNPDLIKKSASRRSRIAKGSGNKIKDVNNLILALEKQAEIAKKLSTMSPEDIENFAQNPGKFVQGQTQDQTQKRNRGKGKRKGGFRF